MNFTHLHNHTVNSKLDGATSVESLFQHLKDCGFDSYAKTDHGTLAGTFSFLKGAEADRKSVV